MAEIWKLHEFFTVTLGTWMFEASLGPFCLLINTLVEQKSSKTGVHIQMCKYNSYEISISGIKGV